jgi:hypothetical protein
VRLIVEIQAVRDQLLDVDVGHRLEAKATTLAAGPATFTATTLRPSTAITAPVTTRTRTTFSTILSTAWTTTLRPGTTIATTFRFWSAFPARLALTLLTFWTGRTILALLLLRRGPSGLLGYGWSLGRCFHRCLRLNRRSRGFR